MKLTNSDYIDILKYYNVYNKKMNTKDVKIHAEKIIADKLCRCIKNVGIHNEKNSIPICVNNVIKKKNLKIYKFKCKKKYKLISNKNIYITKTKKLKLRNNKTKKLKLRNNKTKKY